MSELMIVGVDNGYGIMKTANTDYITGLVEYPSEPAMKTNVIEFEGKYYVIGGKRLSVKNDKTIDNDYYLLTLASIAKELRYRNASKKATIVLSAGLPLKRFGSQKKAFREYLLQNKTAKFNFEGDDYEITFEDVLLNPQGYSAIITEVSSLPANVVLVDIGSWTMDILPITNQIPDQEGSVSINEGSIKCMNLVNEEIRSLYGNDITENQIMSVMQGKDAGLPSKYYEVAKRVIINYTKEKIVAKLQELGYNLDTMSFVFVGGGSNMVKNYGMKYFASARVITDIHANAKGYEYIARKKLGM